MLVETESYRSFTGLQIYGRDDPSLGDVPVDLFKRTLAKSTGLFRDVRRRRGCRRAMQTAYRYGTKTRHFYVPQIVGYHLRDADEPWLPLDALLRLMWDVWQAELPVYVRHRHPVSRQPLMYKADVCGDTPSVLSYSESCGISYVRRKLRTATLVAIPSDLCDPGPAYCLSLSRIGLVQALDEAGRLVTYYRAPGLIEPRLRLEIRGRKATLVDGERTLACDSVGYFRKLLKRRGLPYIESVSADPRPVGHRIVRRRQDAVPRQSED